MSATALTIAGCIAAPTLAVSIIERIERVLSGEDTWALVGPAIEVLFIASLVYLLFKLVQGTRGAGILRGMVIFFMFAFALAFVGSRTLELTHLGWVLENMLTLSVVGIIIIFQPEIRRGLVRVGQNPLVRPFVRSHTPVIDEIAEACTNMARRKLGALIAIQRIGGLRNFVEGGTRLDAEVSAPLIRTVFEKDTPLHDGAIIVQGSRIAAAGCLFPLSENPNISKELGTRHRAGVGLTEESDAVVVIVSEETSRISVAVGGELMRGLSREDLHAVLMSLCTEHVD
jgi:diadenylate cyclase